MSLDPDTLALLKVVFEESCDLLPLHKRTHEMRSALAIRILKCAARGERNPTRLRAYALAETTEPQSSHAIPNRRSPRARIDKRRYE
jgi:hypothetical protein